MPRSRWAATTGPREAKSDSRPARRWTCPSPTEDRQYGRLPVDETGSGRHRSVKPGPVAFPEVLGDDHVQSLAYEVGLAVTQ
jgi:protocatechuate 3,4-dioxygenase beta subunit